MLVKGAHRRPGEGGEFAHANIFLVGLNQLRLRMSGYLPSLVTGDTAFKGNPVFVLESNRYYDPGWFYESELPERFNPIFAAHQTEGVPNSSTKDEDRKSFLATPLFLDADFWSQPAGLHGPPGPGRQRRRFVNATALEFRFLEHRALLPLARDPRPPPSPR